MIEPSDPSRPADREEEAPGEGSDGEVLDALPVLAGERRMLLIERLSRVLARDRRADGMTPAVQAAAVAAGGFVAGAAFLGLVHRRQRRPPALGRLPDRGRSSRRARRGRGGVERLEIVGSRSLLVDVHLLGLPGSER